MDFTKLQELLISLKWELVWGFLLKNSNYEWFICEILWMSKDTWRYWDAQWNGLKIEFKKWASIWIDLVRYSEVILWIDEDAKMETITLFFIPNKDKTAIKTIYWVKTNKLIDKFILNIKIADSLIKLNKSIPKTFNAQVNLSVKDIREIADFIV